ncbi:MAG: hypothetical protein HY001_05060, partial [Candidatus Portnoybacteria bacterium]|nr:hypothetical protein [Candidatus Portnoybacteria bacterium]
RSNRTPPPKPTTRAPIATSINIFLILFDIFSVPVGKGAGLELASLGPPSEGSSKMADFFVFPIASQSRILDAFGIGTPPQCGLNHTFVVVSNKSSHF